MSYSPNLPDIFPTEDVSVSDEEHRFNTYQDSDGDIFEVVEYTLGKAPVQRIDEVTGVLDGQVTTFEQGEDYRLSNDNERIVWIGRTPDPGSTFFVDYRSESVIGRFIKSNSEQMERIDETFEQIIESKFIEHAEGEDLDQIGDLFGPIGRRLGRDDTRYRIYLKSIVQSFVSRGTRDDIKTALSAATDVPKEDITINENFQERQYDITIDAATPITGSLIEDVAEIADPSGVEQLRTRLTVPADSMAVSDSFDVRGTTSASSAMGTTDSSQSFQSPPITDTLSNDDSAISNESPTIGEAVVPAVDVAGRQSPSLVDTITTSVGVSIDGNTQSITSDTNIVDVARLDTPVQSSDNMTTADGVSIAEDQLTWDNVNWGNAVWRE